MEIETKLRNFWTLLDVAQKFKQDDNLIELLCTNFPKEHTIYAVYVLGDGQVIRIEKGNSGNYLILFYEKGGGSWEFLDVPANLDSRALFNTCTYHWKLSSKELDSSRKMNGLDEYLECFPKMRELLKEGKAAILDRYDI